MIEIYEMDGLSISVTVTESDGSAFDLTGYDLEVACQLNSNTPVPGTINVTSLAGGTLTVSFAAGSFLGSTGRHTLHLRAASGSNAQTILDQRFMVKRSAIAAE